MSELQQLTQTIEKGNRAEAIRLVKVLVEKGMAPLDIVEKGLVPGMANVGEKFKRNEVFVPEMLIAARAMKECMAILEPMLVKAGIKPKFTAIIGRDNSVGNCGASPRTTSLRFVPGSALTNSS